MPTGPTPIVLPMWMVRRRISNRLRVIVGQRKRINRIEFIPEREEKLKQLQSDYDAKTTSPERKKLLKEQLEQMQREVADLKKYSFLIAKADPYVVLPGFMFRQPNHPFQPKLGDYVVVIYQGKLYPALLGDVGPSYKIGEASLRICSELDPRSNPYNRPASDLNITYIVFPGSAEDPPGPPDLQKLHDRCAALLNEIGGYTGELWAWEDVLAKPSPSPQESASSRGTASPTLRHPRHHLPARLPSPGPSLRILPRRCHNRPETTEVIHTVTPGVGAEESRRLEKISCGPSDESVCMIGHRSSFGGGDACFKATRRIYRQRTGSALSGRHRGSPLLDHCASVACGCRQSHRQPAEFC